MTKANDIKIKTRKGTCLKERRKRKTDRKRQRKTGNIGKSIQTPNVKSNRIFIVLHLCSQSRVFTIKRP